MWAFENKIQKWKLNNKKIEKYIKSFRYKKEGIMGRETYFRKME